MTASAYAYTTECVLRTVHNPENRTEHILGSIGRTIQWYIMRQTEPSVRAYESDDGEERGARRRRDETEERQRRDEDKRRNI